ncbi:hypothetical protein FJZ19_02510 [Candidatus Pacearchaeota archaeon]|nr:hypothetical protein [Candidatus Pacearchaeota archaeon]
MKKVLYVESFPCVRIPVTDGLRSRGYEVTAVDFCEAKRLQRESGLARLGLDVIVAALPGREGPVVFETAKEFFDNLADSMPPVPIIIDMYKGDDFDLSALMNQFRGKNARFLTTSLSSSIPGIYDKAIKEALKLNKK